jgi:hypothetical protein
MKSSLLHLAIALAVCVAALSGYGVWYAAVSDKSTHVTALQNKIDARTASVARMERARATFAEMAGDEAAVQGYFVPETGVVPFIDSLENRGSTLGAAVNVLSVSKDKTSAQLAFALSVKGSFDAVMRTIGAIEYAPYAITVTSLVVSQESEGGWRADLKLSVGSVTPKIATSTP